MTLTEARELDLRDLRLAGGAMLGVGMVLSRLPGHEGLPCPMRTLTGIPCPLCGGTTAVEETFRLHLGQAVAANPAGPTAVVVAVALVAFRPTTLRISLLPILVALAAMWVFELVRFSIL